MNLGVDLGNCVVSRKREGDGSFESLPVEGMFDILPILVKRFTNTYIISRVNSEQKKRSLVWLEKYDFFNRTGIPQENLYYCFDRRDKAIFQRGLKIRIMIDDRPDCLIPMEKHVVKILFNPIQLDLDKKSDELNKLENLVIVKNWKEVGEYLGVLPKRF